MYHVNIPSNFGCANVYGAVGIGNNVTTSVGAHFNAWAGELGNATTEEI